MDQTPLRQRLIASIESQGAVAGVFDPERFGPDEAFGFDLVFTTADLASRADDAAQALVEAPRVVVLRLVEEQAPEQTVETALADHAQRLKEELERRPANEPRLRDFLSSTPELSSFSRTVHRVVDADASLLILGETGVGKERLARAIHAAGPRRHGPFLAVNCGALPESLLESELFGHERGAFTGAVRSRRGHFELAHGGTIFLDEIGEMPLHLQTRLLRVLQERSIRPIGGERAVEFDVRVMAATNRNLATEITEGRFRPDLFYRLGVVTLTIPPIRERRGDIAELAERYLLATAKRLGRPAPQLTPATMAVLTTYDWPGNVRQLVNVIERAVLLCSGGRIEPTDLPEELGPTASDLPETMGRAGALPARYLDMPWRMVRDEVLADLERRYLQALLTDTQGRIREAARRAGMSERALFEKMRRFGLRKEDFK